MEQMTRERKSLVLNRNWFEKMCSIETICSASRLKSLLSSGCDINFNSISSSSWCRWWIELKCERKWPLNSYDCTTHTRHWRQIGNRITFCHRKAKIGQNIIISIHYRLHYTMKFYTESVLDPKIFTPFSHWRANVIWWRGVGANSEGCWVLTAFHFM